MIGNQTVTLFHKLGDRQWKISVIEHCMWCGTLSRRTAGTGQVQADVYTVLLPVTDVSRSILPDDVLILGDHSALSEQTPRRDLLAMRDSLTVTSAVVHAYGSENVRHVEVSGV